MLRNSSPTRVVITGIGAITPVGENVTKTWDNLVNGTSGIDTIAGFNADHLPVRIAAEVKQFDPHQFIPKKAARRMARCSQFAVATAIQAV